MSQEVCDGNNRKIWFLPSCLVLVQKKNNTCWSPFLISTMFGSIYLLSRSEGGIGKNKL
jgi:hypothetical protein